MSFPPDATAWPGLHDVSCETTARLTHFVEMLAKWNKSINLVSSATMADVWVRHIKDSAQVWALAQAPWRTWVDIGSGGGLPGVVVSIIAKELAPDSSVTLIESDQRKSAFLRSAVRELGLSAKVITARVERVDALGADVLSARALASLSDLLRFADLHLAASGQAIFPKGRSVEAELTEAKRDWTFEYESHSSSSDPAATVLIVRNISRA